MARRISMAPGFWAAVVLVILLSGCASGPCDNRQCGGTCCSQRPHEADPQKIPDCPCARGHHRRFRASLPLVRHKEQHQDNEQRYCPRCVKRTDGRGHALQQPRGRALWRNRNRRARIDGRAQIFDEHQHTRSYDVSS
jgi:hypothetical protein